METYREIKFRGKLKGKNKWVFGLLNQSEHKGEYGMSSLTERSYSYYYVDNKTIGQYTGLKDKNGLEIYEGDILQGENSVVYKVFFNNGTFVTSTEGYYVGDKSGRAQMDFPSYSKLFDFKLESIIILTNIHDNPELLTQK